MDKLQTPITAIILCNLELSETLCVKLQIIHPVRSQRLSNGIHIER